MRRLHQLSHQAFRSGFVQVFVANMISYLVAFCGSITYARLLGQHEFGIYAFSYNIISFFLLLNGFGAASGVLQFVSRARDSQLQLSYLRYSLRLGLIFNLFLAFFILIYALFANLPLSGSRNVLLAMAFFPIGRLYLDVLQAYLRATQQNQLLAKFAISSNVFLLVLNIIGIACGSLAGFIVSTYLSYLLIGLAGRFWLKLPTIFKSQPVPIPQYQFITYSVYASFGNAFAQLLFILDVLILGYLIKDAKVVAVYKVATIIPFALNFIPGVISTFFYPYFAKNAHDLLYMRNLYKKLQKNMLLFSGIISLVLIIIAKPLLIFIFGYEYMASVLPFQILTFGFWIVATFRTIPGNILASLGKIRFAMWLNVGIVSINIVVTYVLVLNFGIIGAAIGVVVIYILAGLTATLVLNKHLSSYTLSS